MRHAEISITYAGVDITKDIAPDLEGFSYSEKGSGEADSLTISLQNKGLKWMGAWLPQTGRSNPSFSHSIRLGSSWRGKNS